MKRFLRPVLYPLVCTALLLLSGCLIVSDNKYRHSGNYVSPAAFAQIEVGKTTGEWLRTNLGEATCVKKLDDGTQIWKWSYKETKESTRAVFLLFYSEDEKETKTTYNVELKDDTVIRKWQD